MNEVSFLHPAYLWLVPIFILATISLAHLNFARRWQAREQYGELRLVDIYSRPLRWREQVLALILWSGAISGLFVAAAGPTLPAAPVQVPRGSEQVVAVWDVSKSMLAEAEYRYFLTSETSPPEGKGPFGSRIDMVRSVVIKQLMPALTGNELGVVTYSGNGWVQAEIMSDFASMRWVLDNWVKAGSAPGGGSDYAEGLKTAIALFKEAGPANGHERVIVLFSDGGFTGTSEGLAEALQLLRDNNVRLIVVGVGDNSPVPLPVYNSHGFRTGYVKDEDGQIATAPLEEQNLIDLASRSEGTYIHLDPSSQLEVKWAPALAGSKLEEQRTDVYRFPLAAALLLLLAIFIRATRVIAGPNSRRRQNRS